MATYTRTDLVKQVLFDLGALDTNETPEAEDATAVGQRAQQKLEELYEDGLIPFDLAGDIPARYFLSLVAIVCQACGDLYRFRDPVELAAKAEAGDRKLWKLREKAYMHTPVQADYF